MNFVPMIFLVGAVWLGLLVANIIEAQSTPIPQPQTTTDSCAMSETWKQVRMLTQNDTNGVPQRIVGFTFNNHEFKHDAADCVACKGQNVEK